MTPRREVFLDTDVLAGYLEHRGGTPSPLRALAGAALCFTSVLQATELLAAADGDRARYEAESVLWGLRVLGFHHKYALRFGDLHRTHLRRRPLRDAMTAGMCLESRLPLVTGDPARYAACPGLHVIDADLFLHATGVEHTVSLLVEQLTKAERKA